MSFLLPTNEHERLRALHALNILDTAPEQTFDDITMLASGICDTPIALITFVDETRQWHKSSIGVQVTEIPRAVSLCSRTLLETSLVEICDVRTDERFAENPLVHGAMNFCFYAAMPLVTHDGLALGTLCVIDTKPRALTAEQRSSLEALARQVMNQLELRRTAAKCQEVEDELRASKELLGSVNDSAPIGILCSDAAGQCTYSNQYWQKITGLTFEESCGSGWAGALHENDAAPVIRGWDQCLHHSQEYYGEFRIRDGEGTLYWVHARMRKIASTDGRGQGIVCIVENISERRRIKEELRESEERFALFMNNSPVVAWMKDAETLTHRYVNKAFEDHWNVTQDFVMDKTDFDLWPEPVAARLRANDLTVLSSNEVLRTFEEVPFPDGSMRHWMVFKFPLQVSSGRRFVAGTAIDITQRKDAEAMTQKLREAIEGAIDGMAVLNERGEYLYLNEAHVKLFGYDEMTQLVGRTWKEFYDETEIARIEKEIFPILQSAGKWEGEAIGTRRNGSKFFEGLSLTTIQGGKGLVCVCRDISGQKIAEAELRHTTESLARSNKELEQFAYVASHDLQEPLRMVTNYVQLLEQRYKEKLDSDAREFIAYARDGAERMRSLVTDLLTFSRLDAKGAHHLPVSTDSVLRKTLGDLHVALEESGTTVTFDQLPVALAEETQLGQLFQNLIGNAVKFRSGDTPRIHISATRTQSDGQAEWGFTVADNGIGIDPQFAERIFIIFQRLHTREEYPGTGIGLAVCKKIVEGFGGRIWVESETGKGSTFCFTLRAAQEEE